MLQHRCRLVGNGREQPAEPGIKAATLGYTFDFLRRGTLHVGAGGNYTWYHFPAILNGFYGERPRTRVLYLRARLGG